MRNNRTDSKAYSVITISYFYFQIRKHVKNKKKHTNITKRGLETSVPVFLPTDPFLFVKVICAFRFVACAAKIRTSYCLNIRAKDQSKDRNWPYVSLLSNLEESPSLGEVSSRPSLFKRSRRFCNSAANKARNKSVQITPLAQFVGRYRKFLHEGQETQQKRTVLIYQPLLSRCVVSSCKYLCSPHAKDCAKHAQRFQLVLLESTRTQQPFKWSTETYVKPSSHIC